MKRILFFLLLLSSVTAFAQRSADKVKWSFSSEKINDSTFNLILRASIDEGWHIYAFNPGNDPSLRFPVFSFNKNSSFKLLGKVKENGKIVTEEIKDLDVVLHYFLKNVVYSQKVNVSANTNITGKISYQVCNEKLCLPESEINFSIPITGLKPNSVDTQTASGIVAEDSNQATASPVLTEKDSSKNISDSNNITPNSKTVQSTNTTQNKQSLWSIFITGFLAGLIAFITPCIFSMLPITVSFFTKRSKTKAAGLKNATLYSLSIIAIFSLVGILISLFFKENTMYIISSSIWFNLFVFVIFLVFGISLLGAFEISLPSSWSSKLDSKANTNSFAGIFFMALVLVIVSFSCTSAFISALIIQIVQTHNRLGGVIGFFGFGLALALPFALFAYFPGLLNSLAKSGGWLNSVKVTMGFVELALAMKFLSNVDLQYHWHLLNYDVYVSLWIALAGLLGLYLIGKIKFSHDDELPKNMFGQHYLSVTRLFFAIASFAFMIYLLPGLWGAPLTGISGLLPERKTLEFNLHDNILQLQNGQVSMSSNATGLQPVKYTSGDDKLKSELPGVTAFFDYDEALAASKKTNKPVLLDFTGHSCINCRKMERAVLSKPEVLKELQQNFIVASLYCDDKQSLWNGEKYTSKDGTQVTTLGDKNVDIEVNKYAAIGQPMYIFVDGDGNVIKNAGGYVDDVARFQKIMQDVLNTHNSNKVAP